MSSIVHLPSLKQLRYLVALEEHRHFGKAAVSCFVSQSTLSAGLKELETALDAELVGRLSTAAPPIAAGPRRS